ncbi:MAG: hypothetical protein L6Q55_16010 [Azonexus sp.]|nr:hypothetical protein [Rhodocyclaceae bacterium]MCK6413906.1 hypothetical protein [Azonexus sp.]
MALAGDLAPVDQNPALAGVQVAYDGLGNVIVDAGRPEADRADVLYGSAGADLVLARGGEDSLNGRSGADRLEGGAGGDWIEGGDGGDWLIGGGSVWGRAGRRSQSPQHGDPVAANDCEWRRTA